MNYDLLAIETMLYHISVIIILILYVKDSKYNEYTYKRHTVNNSIANIICADNRAGLYQKGSCIGAKKENSSTCHISWTKLWPCTIWFVQPTYSAEANLEMFWLLCLPRRRRSLITTIGRDSHPRAADLPPIPSCQ